MFWVLPISISLATAQPAAQAVAVTVSNVYEAPLITSAATASFNQGGTGIAYTAQASHEAGTTLVYSIGGTDAALFTVDSATGALHFASSPSTTSPQDAGINNVYDLTVSASDGSHSSAAQTVAITVTAVGKAGDMVIDLGSYGKLIAPVQVEGAWYYYWDCSGNGTNAEGGPSNAGSDLLTHDVLDSIFQYDVNGVLNTAAGTNTTDTYRYATLNGVHVALPTANGGLAFPQGSNALQNGTSYTDAGPITNATTSSSFNDLLAIWDALNGSNTFPGISGVPAGWAINAGYWSATPTNTPGYHFFVTLELGLVNGYIDNPGYGYNVALQVL